MRFSSGHSFSPSQFSPLYLRRERFPSSGWLNGQGVSRWMRKLQHWMRCRIEKQQPKSGKGRARFAPATSFAPMRSSLRLRNHGGRGQRQVEPARCQTGMDVAGGISPMTPVGSGQHEVDVSVREKQHCLHHNAHCPNSAELRPA